MSKRREEMVELVLYEAREIERLFDALSSFAGRMAASDDPRQHQAAGRYLQENLRTIRITANTVRRPK